MAKLPFPKIPLIEKPINNNGHHCAWCFQMKDDCFRVMSLKIPPDRNNANLTNIFLCTQCQYRLFLELTNIFEVPDDPGSYYENQAGFKYPLFTKEIGNDDDKEREIFERTINRRAAKSED